MGKLSTHVLDVVSGRPAAGVAIELFRCTPTRELLMTTVSNSDGRCERPLLEGAAMTAGEYELVFQIGDYFRKSAVAPMPPAFLNSIPIRFTIADAEANYHIPLLASPFSYSTYRGS